MTPLVYIILLNWNGWHDVVACLNSIKQLTYSNYNVIVVDNGSTDDSMEQIRLAHPDIELIQNGENLGFGGGCNVGIREAIARNADYVWLLNSDTKPDNRALDALVSKALSDASLGAVGSVLYHMDEPQVVQAWGGGRVNFFLGRSSHLLNAAKSNDLHYITGASALLKCRALAEVGLFDSNCFFMYWEDTDLCFRLKKDGWRMAVAESSYVWHKESASLGKKSPRLDEYFNASAVNFFRKHSKIPIVPIFLGIGGRLFKRILKGDWARVAAVCRGFENSFTRRGCSRF